MRFSNTNWNLYRSFVATFEAKNLQQAADILGVTKSAVAQNLKELGRQLGVRLFTGHSKGVEPTFEAEELYKKIVPSLDQIIHAEESIVEFNENSAGVVRIVCTSNSSGDYVAKKVSRFIKKYKNAKFDLHIRPLDLAMSELSNGAVDIVIGILPSELVTKYSLKPLPVAPFKITFVSSQDFASERKIGKRISRIQFNEMILITQSPRSYYIKEDLAPSIRVDTQEIALRLVLENAGAAFGLCYYFDNISEQGSLVKFDVEGLEHDDAHLAYASSRLLSKMAAEFLVGFGIG